MYAPPTRYDAAAFLVRRWWILVAVWFVATVVAFWR